MLGSRDTLRLSLDALGSHRLRSALTTLGLAMGVATLITVVTLIQGANVYVETKIANLGTDVFQVARTPFATTDYQVIIKALKYKKVTSDDIKKAAAKYFVKDNSLTAINRRAGGR